MKRGGAQPVIPEPRVSAVANVYVKQREQPPRHRGGHGFESVEARLNILSGKCLQLLKLYLKLRRSFLIPTLHSSVKYEFISYTFIRRKYDHLLYSNYQTTYFVWTM